MYYLNRRSLCVSEELCDYSERVGHKNRSIDPKNTMIAEEDSGNPTTESVKDNSDLDNDIKIEIIFDPVAVKSLEEILRKSENLQKSKGTSQYYHGHWDSYQPIWAKSNSESNTEIEIIFALIIGKSLREIPKVSENLLNINRLYPYAYGHLKEYQLKLAPIEFMKGPKKKIDRAFKPLAKLRKTETERKTTEIFLKTSRVYLRSLNIFSNKEISIKVMNLTGYEKLPNIINLDKYVQGGQISNADYIKHCCGKSMSCKNIQYPKSIYNIHKGRKNLRLIMKKIKMIKMTTQVGNKDYT